MVVFIQMPQRVPHFYEGLLVGFVVLLGVRAPFARRDQARRRAAIGSALQRAYAPLGTPPTCVETQSYGFPFFTITFATRGEMNAAAACNAVFKREMAKILKKETPKYAPFDAEKGIHFTYHNESPAQKLPG